MVSRLGGIWNGEATGAALNAAVSIFSNRADFSLYRNYYFDVNLIALI